MTTDQYHRHAELADAMRQQQRAITRAIEILSGPTVEPATCGTVAAEPCGRCAVLEQEVKAAWAQTGEERCRAEEAGQETAHTQLELNDANQKLQGCEAGAAELRRSLMASDKERETLSYQGVKLRKALEDCERALRLSPGTKDRYCQIAIKSAQVALSGKGPRLYTTAEEIRPLVEALEAASVFLMDSGESSPIRRQVDSAFRYAKTLGL